MTIWKLRVDGRESQPDVLVGVRQSLNSGRLVRLHHADNKAERGHGIAERDLHAHRYHRLQHVDRHGQRNSQQGQLFNSIGFVSKSLRYRTIRELHGNDHWAIRRHRHRFSDLQ